MISYDIASNHIIWYYIIYHISYHITSHHMRNDMAYHMIYHAISYNTHHISYHTISYISYHISYHMYPILSYIIYYKTHQNSTLNRKYIFYWQHHIYLYLFIALPHPKVACDSVKFTTEHVWDQYWFFHSAVNDFFGIVFIRTYSKRIGPWDGNIRPPSNI